MNWDWFAPTIAVVAALAAVWQAAEARRSNKGAAAHEARALDAQTRSAAALERQVEIAEATATIPVPWRFEALSPGNVDQTWHAVNETGIDASNVHITTAEGADERWIVPESHGAIDVPAGAAYRFTFIRRLSSPSSKAITISWSEGADFEPRRYNYQVS